MLSEPSVSLSPLYLLVKICLFFVLFFRKYQICLANITTLRDICICNKDIVFDCGITLGWLVGLGKKKKREKRDFPITHEVAQLKQWPFLRLCQYFILVYL